MSEEQDVPNALLVFSIGPVQEFIATARRTQDLWMGSYILAYLSFEAMDAVGQDAILFPVLEGHPFTDGIEKNGKNGRLLSLATLPNKFTARVDSVDHGKQLAEKAKEAVYDAWREVAAAVEGKFPADLMAVGPDWKATWDEQVRPENWLEVYWVVYPKDGHNYRQLNRHAEAALAARKGLRNFVAAEERGEKDSISGHRAALSSPARQSRRRLRRQWAELAMALRQRSLRPGEDNPYSGLPAALSMEGHEYLSAISSVKRFVQRFFFYKWGLHSGFPSTSSIASAVFRARLLQEDELRQARSDFVRTLGQVKGEVNGRREPIPETLAENAFPPLSEKFPKNALLEYDGDLFYLETYTGRRLHDDYGVRFEEDQVNQLRRSAQQMRRAARARAIPLPPKYYALLLMDGDHMGKKLGEAESPDDHKRISQSLQDFALKHVQRIVEDKYLGRVVYAGGDDLMAFLPLEYALVAPGELMAAFAGVAQDAKGKALTASAGVAIAHHLAPLDLVLQAARRAEDNAKKLYDRNSIVYTVLKRSGEQLDVGGHWHYKDVDTLTVVERVRGYMQDEAVQLSPRFAFDAEAEAQALTAVAAEAQEKRLAYLLKRHSNLEQEKRAALAEALSAIRQGLDEQFEKTAHLAEQKRSAALEAVRWLLLARFLVAAAAGEE